MIGGNTQARRFVDRAVIVFIRYDGHLLLIHKKRGLGQGKINGPGGRLEEGESYLEAAVRETQEEVGLTPSGLYRGADLSFSFADGYSLYAEVFLATGYTGTLISTDEADPFWCPIDEVPYENMWEDDRLWLPLMLNGSYVSGRFEFDGDAMTSHHITTSSLR
ncbi:MAG: 8-oxo-dGTP diphosphatase [Spirochaetota bacterium]